MNPAKALRARMTIAEQAIWRLLRGRGFAGHKFRRQTRIGPWVADFCCYELRLIVELDGGVHRLRESEDAARDLDPTRRGFTVLRFGNELALTSPNVVFDAIKRHAAQQPPHPSGSA
ncbi:DUF559 domain-containing protein [Caulobacter segnis]|nr:DUF559 domain-containing protein [Caulobacter segnis]MDG2520933.1 DUF559 domain-containing protein [Caulobacter segnis]